MENINYELMGHIGIIIAGMSLFLTLILFFVGRLVFLQDRTYKNQRDFNNKLYSMLELNAVEHAAINTKLEKGKIWFDENHNNIEKNSYKIDEHEKRLGKHDGKFIAIDKDLKTLYKKVE